MITKREILQAVTIAMLGLGSLAGGQASAQNSSLFTSAQDAPPLTMNNYSWTYQAADEPRTIKLHDHLVVVVDEKSALISDGLMDRKKKGYGDLALPAFLKLFDWHLGQQPFANGKPHIRGEVDNKLRSQADLETSDMLKFRIACTVVDIRPNGNLVVEGRRVIKNNEETWEYALTGELRPESIMPNNTVLSENVAEMQIVKRETGHVRDGYRRGWLLETMDRWQPF